MSNDEAAEPRTVDDIVRDLLKFMTDRVVGEWPDTTYIGGGQWVKGCEACGAHTGYPADDDHNQGCPHVALIAEARAYLEAERAGKPSAPCSICGEPGGAGHSLIGHDLAVIKAQRSCSCRGAAEPCAACIAAGGFGPLPAPAAPTTQWLRAIAAADAERTAADVADPSALAREVATALIRDGFWGAHVANETPGFILNVSVDYVARCRLREDHPALAARVEHYRAAQKGR